MNYLCCLTINKLDRQIQLIEKIKEFLQELKFNKRNDYFMVIDVMLNKYMVKEV